MCPSYFFRCFTKLANYFSMGSFSGNNHRITRNTLMLCIRMGVVMIISLCFIRIHLVASQMNLSFEQGRRGYYNICRFTNHSVYYKSHSHIGLINSVWLYDTHGPIIAKG